MPLPEDAEVDYKHLWHRQDETVAVFGLFDILTSMRGLIACLLQKLCKGGSCACVLGGFTETHLKLNTVDLHLVQKLALALSVMEAFPRRESSSLEARPRGPKPQPIPSDILIRIGHVTYQPTDPGHHRVTMQLDMFAPY